jgi:hypothetical protein
MQPAQQQGLRIPPASFEIPFLMRIFLVSAFLPEITQQIHSLRASGVISSHAARAAGAETRALRKSAGIVCTIELFYQIFWLIAIRMWWFLGTGKKNINTSVISC